MKTTTFLLLALAIALIAACQKNPQPIVEGPENPIDTIIPSPQDTHIIALGKSFVLKDGNMWNVPFKAVYNPATNIFEVFARKTFANGVTQSFGLRDIPRKAGKYAFEFWPSAAALHPNSIPESSFGMMYDGDQGIGSFFLDTLRNDHFIEVLRYDTVTNIAEGRYQVFLKKRKTNGWVPAGITVPDSIAMTEGKFHLQVEHY